MQKCRRILIPFVITFALAGHTVLAEENSNTAGQLQAIYKSSHAVEIKAFTYKRPFWKRLFGIKIPEEKKRIKFTMGGSGFLINDNGEIYVLTAYHVVCRADRTWILFNNGQMPQEMEIAGYDKMLDTALLKFKDKNYAPPVVPEHADTLGDSDALEEGDLVAAVGSSVRSFIFSSGIVMKQGTGLESYSEKGGYAVLHPKVILSSAKVNPGNSGGPLYNARGEVVGINVRSFGGWNFPESITISVAISDVKKMLPELEKGGEVKHGTLGAYVFDASKETPLEMKEVGFEGTPGMGTVVLNVVGKSAAEKAGIVPGDIIVFVGNNFIMKPQDFFEVILTKKPGDTVSVVVVRKNEILQKTVVLDPF